MSAPTTAPHVHKISWFVVVDGERMPRERTMRGTWAFEATCSCGWDSRTGGATESFVRFMVRSHKWNVDNGFETRAI